MRKLITTEDGSSSYFNEKYQEAYHSKVGAYTEALEKYVKPCKILEMAEAQKSSPEQKQGDCIKILDVCFGLGYNSGLAIEKALELFPDCKIKIIGLENDTEIIKKISELNVPANYEEIKNVFSNFVIKKNFTVAQSEFETVFHTTYRNCEICVIIGDARENIQKIILKENEKFDAVFFDPFSPKVCPELWTFEFIRDVVNKAQSQSLIATYSSARIAKDNFKKSNCEISEGPAVGRRSGGVIARVIT